MSKLSTNGFGIIECLISILLLTFIMVGGMSFYIYSNSHLKIVTFERIAADLANSKMEEIKRIGYGNFTTYCPDTNPDTTHTVGSLPANITACMVSPYYLNDGCADCGNYKHVQVTVSWMENNLNKQVALDSFIAE